MKSQAFGVLLALSATVPGFQSVFAATYYVAPSVDLDGKPRLIGPRVDIGCYESVIQPGLLMLVR